MSDLDDLIPMVALITVGVIVITIIMHMALMSMRSAEQLLLDAVRRSEGDKFDISL